MGLDVHTSHISTWRSRTVFVLKRHLAFFSCCHWCLVCHRFDREQAMVILLGLWRSWLQSLAVREAAAQRQRKYEEHPCENRLDAHCGCSKLSEWQRGRF